MTDLNSNGHKSNWRIEVIKYGGAIGVIVAITWMLNTVFANTQGGTDAKVFELWERQINTLSEIKNILFQNLEVNKHQGARLDSLNRKMDFAIGRQVTGRDDSTEGQGVT